MSDARRAVLPKAKLLIFNEVAPQTPKNKVYKTTWFCIQFELILFFTEHTVLVCSVFCVNNLSKFVDKL